MTCRIIVSNIVISIIFPEVLRQGMPSLTTTHMTANSLGQQHTDQPQYINLKDSTTWINTELLE